MVDMWFTAWQLLATGECVAIEVFPNKYFFKQNFIFAVKSPLDQKLCSLEELLLD